MWINTELADKYQEFFDFMSQEHNLTLTISEMNEILSEAKKLESKLHQPNVISSVCGGCAESTGETKLWCCNHCGNRIEEF